FHPHGVLNRAAPVADGEDLHGLREVPALPSVRSVRDGRAARRRLRRRARVWSSCRCGGVGRVMSGIAQTLPGGVTAARGYRAAGVSAGIKANGNPDLALVVSDVPAQAAAVFTTNKAMAAPVIVSRDHLTRSGGVARAIVVNSGCANACTGEEGISVARETA